MSRRGAIVVCGCLLALLAVTARAAAELFASADPHPPLGDGSSSSPDPVSRGSSSGHRRELGRGQIRFDGAGPEQWAARFRRERRAVITMRRELAAKVSRLVYLVDAFQCIHGYEGAWTANTGNGYRGGLQFGAAEWRLYGGRYATTADAAAPAEQIAAGIAYHAVAGFWPWPNTARRCGLIP